MKYRKKVVVDAEVYSAGMEDGWEYEDKLPDWTPEMFEASKVDGVRMYPYINTREGRHYIGKGDWIITGIEGERYPCKPSIFAKTYEPAE